MKEPVRLGSRAAQLLLDGLGQVPLQLLLRIELNALRIPRPRHLNFLLERPPALKPLLPNARIVRINLKLPRTAKIDLAPRLRHSRKTRRTKREIAERNEKKRKKKSKQRRWTVTIRLMQSLGHGELANLELGRPEIDEGPMFQTCRAQVAERLGDMVINDRLGGLDLQDKLSLHHDVSDVLANDRGVFIEDSQWLLLLDGNASLPQSMDESILIHLLQMTWAVIAVDDVARLANNVRQLKDTIFHSSSLQDLRSKQGETIRGARGLSGVLFLLFSPFFVFFGNIVLPVLPATSYSKRLMKLL
jgi:hypothetical protein